jgi:hypothetical protein
MRINWQSDNLTSRQSVQYLNLNNPVWQLSAVRFASNFPAKQQSSPGGGKRV